MWLSRCRNTARYVIAAPFTYRNWWAVPLPKLGKSVVLELRDGTKYLVRAGTTDLAAVNEAAILNPYLRRPLIVLSEDATVIDIGAYIGDFTMQVARACPRGRILAVEPNSANVRMIETQMALNHVSHVETVRAAVGGTNRRAGLSGDGMGARVTEGGDDGVEVVTLESLMDRYGIDSVDLLKLDCEGAEWDILPPPNASCRASGKSAWSSTASGAGPPSSWPTGCGRAASSCLTREAPGMACSGQRDRRAGTDREWIQVRAWRFAGTRIAFRLEA